MIVQNQTFILAVFYHHLSPITYQLLVPNTRNNANKAPMPATSARISRTSIFGKIFGAAEGWRPKALMEMKPTAVITNNGPKMVRNITKRMTKFCTI